MCMGLGCDHGHDFVSHLSGCTGLIFDQRFPGFFLVEVSQSSSPSSLVARNHRNQYYASAWGSCTGCHCNKGALGLHLSLNFSFAAPACESARPLTY
jgi:hypothetical protein